MWFTPSHGEKWDGKASWLPVLLHRQHGADTPAGCFFPFFVSLSGLASLMLISMG